MKTKRNFDCVLVMEDILEKLKLLDYEKNFCEPLEWYPVNKIYFAMDQNEKSTEKFWYFIELSYWIMSLSKKK